MRRIEDDAGKQLEHLEITKVLETFITTLIYSRRVLLLLLPLPIPLVLMMDMSSGSTGAKKPGSGSDSSGFKAKSVPTTLSESPFIATTKKPGQLTGKMAARRPQNQRLVVPQLISKPSQTSNSQQVEVLQISSAESSPKDTTSELPLDWEVKVGMGSTHTLWSQYDDNKGALTLYKGNQTVNDIAVKIGEGNGLFSSTSILEGDPSATPVDLFGPALLLGHPPAKAQGDISGNQDSEVSADLIATLENENRALLDTIMELRNSNTHFNEQRRKASMAEYMYVHLRQLQLQRSVANFESRKISAERLVDIFKQHLRELENIGNKFLEDLPEYFGRTEFDEMFSGVKRDSSESIDIVLEAPPAKKFRPVA
ncbi:hypothetical protein IW261DRAFT_1558816 [Armillaria novae-zelandiae]|uniref:Uncharacterized protein n=1 Tax=Armillaria novae-zelandiae TaxID=153914 RepID=A0AA39PNU7_9AGAR|nr:hypothetical protein IW261DRAFT_1558816 [Armillaria novae-zelandiae]